MRLVELVETKNPEKVQLYCELKRLLATVSQNS